MADINLTSSVIILKGSRLNIPLKQQSWQNGSNTCHPLERLEVQRRREGKAGEGCVARARRRSHAAQETPGERRHQRQSRPRLRQRSTPQEEVPDMNVYALSNKVLKQTKQKRTEEGETDNFNSWRFQYPTFNKECNSCGKDQQEKKT